jgi:antitoxin component of RelBE/YafQ-DinJ toxin-antitoxin module
MTGTQCNMRLQPSDLRRFRRVAKKLGLNVSEAIRYLMKLADDAMKPSKPKMWGADDYR